MISSNYHPRTQSILVKSIVLLSWVSWRQRVSWPPATGSMRRPHYALLILYGGIVVLGRRLFGGSLRPSWSIRTELVVMAVRTLLDCSKRRGFQWLRETLEAMPTHAPVFKQVRFEPVDAGGVAAEWCRPLAGGEPSRVLIYFHGGGYVAGSVRTHREFVARLSLEAQSRVLSVDYRLAPECPFPAAQDDCLTAYRWVVAGGRHPSSIALVGNSAGGILCISTLLALRDAGEPCPGAALLISPWVDPLAATGSILTNEPFDVGDREFLVRCIETYMSGRTPNRPSVAPVYADLRGLPPLFIQVGAVEILLDQVQRFALRAQDMRVVTRLVEYEDMFHTFQSFASFIPTAARAVRDMGRFLRQRIPDPVLHPQQQLPRSGK